MAAKAYACTVISQLEADMNLKQFGGLKDREPAIHSTYQSKLAGPTPARKKICIKSANQNCKQGLTCDSVEITQEFN